MYISAAEILNRLAFDAKHASIPQACAFSLTSTIISDEPGPQAASRQFNTGNGSKPHGHLNTVKPQDTNREGRGGSNTSLWEIGKVLHRPPAVKSTAHAKCPPAVIGFPVKVDYLPSQDRSASCWSHFPASYTMLAGLYPIGLECHARRCVCGASTSSNTLAEAQREKSCSKLGIGFPE